LELERHEIERIDKKDIESIFGVEIKPDFKLKVYAINGEEYPEMGKC